MRVKFAVVILVAVMPVAVHAGLFNKDTADEQRAEIQQIREDVLARLYEEKPDTEEMIAKAEGYAVFTNRGINLLLVSTANGKGLAHDNEYGTDIYMNMFSAGAGLGAGIKKFSAVFVFHDREAFEQFVDKGWNFTGQADAAATTDAEEEAEAGSAEGVVGLNEGVSVYQLTEKGLALQVTLQGTKYWKDDDLN